MLLMQQEIQTVTLKMAQQKNKERQLKEAVSKIEADRLQLNRYQDDQEADLRLNSRLTHIKEAILQEEDRYTVIVRECTEIHLENQEKESQLARIAEETDANNHRLKREQSN